MGNKRRVDKSKTRRVLPERLYRDQVALIQYVRRMEPEHTVDDIALIFNIDKTKVSRALKIQIDDPLLAINLNHMDPEQAPETPAVEPETQPEVETEEETTTE